MVQTAKKDYLNTVSYPQLWDNSISENIPNENFTDSYFYKLLSTRHFKSGKRPALNLYPQQLSK